jgi:hypothetical protein
MSISPDQLYFDGYNVEACFPDINGWATAFVTASGYPWNVDTQSLGTNFEIPYGYGSGVGDGIIKFALARQADDVKVVAIRWTDTGELAANVTLRASTLGCPIL